MKINTGTLGNLYFLCRSRESRSDTNEQEEMTRNYVNNDSNFDLDVTPVACLALCRRTNFEGTKVPI